MDIEHQNCVNVQPEHQASQQPNHNNQQPNYSHQTNYSSGQTGNYTNGLQENCNNEQSNSIHQQPNRNQAASRMDIENATSPQCVEPIFLSEHQVPYLFVKPFPGGVCSLNKAPARCRIHLHFDKIQQQSASSLQQLFIKPNQAVDLAFVVSNEYMSDQLKKQFKNAANLHLFLANHLGSDRVSIDRQKIRLVVAENRHLDINIEEQLFLESQRNRVSVEVDGIEDKLLLFRDRDWEELRLAYEAIDQTADPFFDQCHILNNSCDQRLTRDQEAIMKFLKEEQERIEAFDKQFSEILNLNSKAASFAIPAKPYQAPAKQYPTGPANPGSQVFPQGYCPPQTLKPADGFAPEEHLRLHANQTKKEKLRMSKQMLKMGYSVDEVIQRLEQIERTQKTGKVQNKNVYVAPTQGPVRPFHIPREQNHSMSFKGPRNVPNPRLGNERVVRERLIALLREKRYKKLEDIQKHMSGEGIETTVEILKAMIDEIRNKNAQKRLQTQQH